MAPEPCPVCNAPGGFHDRDIHAGPVRPADPAGAHAVARVLGNHVNDRPRAVLIDADTVPTTNEEQT